MFADELGFHRTVSIARHQGGAWPQWYGDPPSPDNRQAPEHGMTPELVGWLCEGAEVLLSFECWYGDFVPALAQRLGVKTALMPMYECCPAAGGGLEATDLAICPSRLDWEEMQYKTPGLDRAVKRFIPVPFDTRRMPLRRRKRALTFVHNAGHGGLGGRNSTAEVLEAWRYVKAPARLILRVQPGMELASMPNDPRIRLRRTNPENYWELFRDGDVLLHPHKWDGLSLPIQEALAAGMPVMTTRYWPFCNDGARKGWLPACIQEIAIAPRDVRKTRICRAIDAFCADPKNIAAAVDRLYCEDLEPLSSAARRCAEQYSWEKLLPRYREALTQLVKGE